MKTAIVFAVMIMLVVSCSGDSKNNSDSKKRRNENKTSSSKKQVTLPPIPTASAQSTLPQDTKPISELAFLNPDQIKSEWTSEKLCSLMPAREVKSILQMDTIPETKYSFSKDSGARCTIVTGSGDEAYVEISIISFANSRSVDKSLKAEGEAVVLKGIGGVVKSSTANGTTYELNISGAGFNQWTVNGPSESKAKKLAELFIASLT